MGTRVLVLVVSVPARRHNMCKSPEAPESVVLKGTERNLCD
jgi:hypothetical protein